MVCGSVKFITTKEKTSININQDIKKGYPENLLEYGKIKNQNHEKSNVSPSQLFFNVNGISTRYRYINLQQII